MNHYENKQTPFFKQTTLRMVSLDSLWKLFKRKVSAVIKLPAIADLKSDFAFMGNYMKSLQYGDRI